MAAKKRVDYDRIEAGWRAGVLSPHQLAATYTEETGEPVSHTAIIKHFRKLGVPRDLSQKIHAKADAMVTAAMVTGKVSAETIQRDNEIIEAGACVVANVRIEHRKDIQRNRSLATKLLAELEAQTGDPELFAQLSELMASSDIDAPDKLNELYRKVISLPSRIDSAKKLAETLRVTIALEREAYGMDKEQKADTGLSSESIGTLKKLKAALENGD